MKKIITAIAGFVLAGSMLCSAQQKVSIVAHRGYWKCENGGGGTNSMAALKEAIRLKFWGSEFDINMTSDGELMVFHDGNAGGKNFNDNPASAFADYRIENGEPIPTLDQYLAELSKSKKTVAVLELKWHKSREMERQAAEKCVALLKKYNMFSPKRVIFISFSLEACKDFAELAPGFTVQFLHNNVRPAEVAAVGVNGMDTIFTTLLKDETWYSECRANGMSVNCWTVDNKEDMRKMIEMGVDQLTTNQPEVARALLKEMGIKERKAGQK